MHCADSDDLVCLSSDKNTGCLLDIEIQLPMDYMNVTIKIMIAAEHILHSEYPNCAVPVDRTF